MLPLKTILSKINYLKYIGSDDVFVSELIELNESNERNDILCWCSDKNIDILGRMQHGTIICSEKISQVSLNKDCNYIICAQPRNTFKEILTLFFYKDHYKDFISSTAKIHENVKLGKNVFVGDGVVLEEGCNVGDNSQIGHNTIIYRNTIIGKNVVIGANNTIGGIGFGYTKGTDSVYELIPHIGNVVLEDCVEVGNNTCIDRAVLGSTILCENVKVDNLVHIAHGVVVGKRSLIIANTVIGGSSKIGEDTWISPGVSVLNKIKIGNNCLIGMGSVVIRDVEDNSVVVGNPAKKIRDNK